MQWYWLIASALVIVSVLTRFTGILTFDTSLPWSAWVVAGLVLLNGGWMAFDGGRAIVVGDYVTPRSGPLTGTLGPWSRLVAATGIDPRSTLMKYIFLLYGLVFLAATSREEQDSKLDFLLRWATDYYSRDGDMPLVAHQELFERYSGPKRLVTDLSQLS